MTSELWRKIEELFQAAVARPREEQCALLDQASAGDESLRREVEKLLACARAPNGSFDKIASGVAARWMAESERQELIGQCFGHYEILAPLGSGGMGEVYLARDKSLDRKVALKLLPRQFTQDRDRLPRFEQEARAASALNHPNILTVYEVGADNATHYIASELIEGETLRHRLARGSMQLGEVVDIAIQVAAALAAAHSAGVVHRDVKPENIMLRPDGYVKVLDFGIAKLAEQEVPPAMAEPAFAPQSRDYGAAGEEAVKLVETNLGSILGTVCYMSPEQARPAVRGIDKRTDIWSLGVVLYEMAAGCAPFTGDTPAEVMAAILAKEPSPLNTYIAQAPGELQRIVTKALQKDPAKRYQSASEMLEALKGLHRKLEFTAELERSAARRLWQRCTRSPTALALALLAGAFALALPFYLLRNPTTSSAPDKSIAVLPFADLSQARDQEYFCDGIQEEILTRLSKVADLKVISRTSAQRFKSAPKNLPEIAKQLGVANILEGTVQKTEGQVRVNVQLINARNDSHLWAEKYDRNLTDVFGVESEIAKAIADALRAKLTGAEQRAIATRPTANPEAHLLYLKGAYFSNKRTGPDLRTAIEFFKEAIGKDPNYALAYAGLADAWALFSLYGGEGPQETMPQAKEAARKALELDDTLPEAHNSLGMVLALYDFDFAQSKSEFERAIALNPNYATAHHQFGNLNLSMVGEFDRAIAEGKRAVELDPLSLIINADLGQDFMLARRYDEAIDQLRKTLALDPRFYYARWTLGEALQMRGQLGEAMAEYEKAAEITDDPHITGLLAQGYAKIGQRDKALNLLSQLEQLSTHRHVGLFTFALAHLAVGDNEKAIDDLEQAYREHDPNIVDIKVEPLFDPLRGHPRFERLVVKVLGAAEKMSPGER